MGCPLRPWPVFTTTTPSARRSNSSDAESTRSPSTSISTADSSTGWSTGWSTGCTSPANAGGASGPDHRSRVSTRPGLPPATTRVSTGVAAVPGIQVPPVRSAWAVRSGAAPTSAPTSAPFHRARMVPAYCTLVHPVGPDGSNHPPGKQKRNAHRQQQRDHTGNRRHDVGIEVFTRVVRNEGTEQVHADHRQEHSWKTEQKGTSRTGCSHGTSDAPTLRHRAHSLAPAAHIHPVDTAGKRRRSTTCHRLRAIRFAFRSSEMSSKARRNAITFVPFPGRVVCLHPRCCTRVAVARPAHGRWAGHPLVAGADHKRRALIRLTVVGAMGIVTDSGLMATGALVFPDAVQALPTCQAPVWMVALWVRIWHHARWHASTPPCTTGRGRACRRPVRCARLPRRRGSRGRRARPTQHAPESCLHRGGLGPGAAFAARRRWRAGQRTAATPPS